MEGTKVRIYIVKDFREIEFDSKFAQELCQEVIAQMKEEKVKLEDSVPSEVKDRFEKHIKETFEDDFNVEDIETEILEDDYLIPLAAIWAVAIKELADKTPQERIKHYADLIEPIAQKYGHGRYNRDENQVEFVASVGDIIDSRFDMKVDKEEVKIHWTFMRDCEVKESDDVFENVTDYDFIEEVEKILGEARKLFNKACIEEDEEDEQIKKQ
jgi:hypothetical protein